MTEQDRPAPRRRRAPDPLALLCGLAALAVAGSGFTGMTVGSFLDVRWLLALAAVLAGVSFIVMSLRNSRTTSDE